MLKSSSPFPLIVCALLFALCPAPALAGNVTITDNGTYFTLGNGTVTAKITKSSAQVTSLVYLGKETVSGNIYFSADGGTSYEQPGNGAFWIKTNTTDRVDVGFRCTMTNSHWFNVDIHYVLGRNDSGLYVYAELDHPASYPATSIGEWRMVWKMPQDQTERIYVDNLRNWQKPSSADLAAASPTGIGEIVKINTGLWAGKYNCKYMYAVEYEDVGCYGHASNPNKFGVWAVFGGYDFFNDGPTKQDLAPADGIIHIHFGRNHFNASSISVAAGESWTKLFGPWLLYCNTNAAGGNACWADAKAKVQTEKAAWPYSWLTGMTNYPLANARGAVSGRFIVSDALKPALAAGTNTWIGLAQIDAGGSWQFESKRYQYWVHPDAAGNFVIPNVRPGTFTLFAFTPGAVGEFSLTNVTVTAAATNALGNVNWNVPHPGGSIAWEIGIPDRRASEFRHGTNYWTPYLWETYSNVFPNPLEYTVGSSNWTNDWNYAQPGYNVGTNWLPWKWRVNFNLTNLPPGGNATLTLAWAGAHYGSVQVYVNDESTLLADVGPTCFGGPTGGNGLIREVIHAKYGVNYLPISVARLRSGTNTITLLQRRSSNASDHVMYDYVNLELPPGPPSPPPGRNLNWRGGLAANAWDITNTLNWIIASNVVATTFTNGDNVTFDDSGSNNVPISVNSTMLPGSLTVNAAKNFTIAGTGSLGGTMYLFKTGNGSLTLNGSNTFAGGATLSSGIVQLGSSETNNAGIGIGAITFIGGTLRLNGYAASTTPTWAAFPNDLIIPAGQSGTLGCPPRIAGTGISGRLTGDGSLNLVVDYVRGLVNADWSQFAGQINVTARRAAPNVDELRVKPVGGYPNASIHLGSRVNFYNLNGGTPTYDIGELSGDAGSLLSTPGGNSGGQPVNWRVGGLNTSSEFAGNIMDQTGLIKVGTGMLTLSGTNTSTRFTAVGGGTLAVTGLINTTNFVVVSNFATLALSGEITASQVQINSGGTLTGCGTITGDLLNNGTVLADCGAPGNLVVVGNVTNNGTMQFVFRTGLQCTGTFVNNGVLDLLTGAQGLPANFINNGVVIDSSDTRITSASVAGSMMTLTIPGYAGHSYQLQRAASLTSPNWQNVSLPQEGLGAPLTFTDVIMPGEQFFYRILVAP